MWKNNFRTYTYRGISEDNITDLAVCDKIIQNMFNNAILHMGDKRTFESGFSKLKSSSIELIKIITKEDNAVVLNRAFDLGVAKNADYGESNILKFGLIGILVRLGDKLARIQNLLSSQGSPNIKNEKIEDTLLDMINYSTYGQMLNDGIWK